ncbi:MAG: BlaI/MecI/CopY family transcriptional regulator [Actinobacteria bacterium]|nr:BlaI/MecI/CopY family transcriptional regulator [Actinomycetota bacterium]
MATDPQQRDQGSRRGLGPREAAAMQIFWRRPGKYLSVRQVNETLDAGLAYTTVMTLLTRLHRKGFLERRLDGRAWTYRPLMSQSQHAATAMAAALHDSDDRAQALFHFVERLTPEEQQQLRRKLEGDDR